MTTIIGFACKNAILMASERQHSFTTSDSSKRTDGTKIETVEFENGLVLVGHSGMIIYSQGFVDKFHQLAAGRPIADKWTVPNVAQEAMRALYNDMRANRGGCTADELDLWLLKEGITVQSIFAFFHAGQKFIYTIRLGHSMAMSAKSYYVAIGSGSTLAEYIIDTSAEPNIHDYHASLIAVHAIESVKRYDTYCGGPTTLAMLTDGEMDSDERGKPHVYFMSPEAISEYAQAYSDADAEGCAHRNKLLAHLHDADGKKFPEAG